MYLQFVERCEPGRYLAQLQGPGGRQRIESNDVDILRAEVLALVAADGADRVNRLFDRLACRL